MTIQAAVALALVMFAWKSAAQEKPAVPGPAPCWSADAGLDARASCQLDAARLAKLEGALKEYFVQCEPDEARRAYVESVSARYLNSQVESKSIDETLLNQQVALGRTAMRDMWKPEFNENACDPAVRNKVITDLAGREKMVAALIGGASPTPPPTLPVTPPTSHPPVVSKDGADENPPTGER